MAERDCLTKSLQRCKTMLCVSIILRRLLYVHNAAEHHCDKARGDRVAGRTEVLMRTQSKPGFLIIVMLVAASSSGCRHGVHTSADQVRANDTAHAGVCLLPNHGAPTVKTIAEWLLIDGSEELTIVRLLADGRVEMSSDLSIGGAPFITGTLSSAELERFQSTLTRMTNGLDDEDVNFALDPKGSYGDVYHVIRIRLPSGLRLTLTTSMRFFEVERFKASPTIFAGPRDFWSPLEGGTRVEALRTRQPDHMALRTVWLEVEAEMLRAAGQSLLPDHRRRRISRSAPE